MKYILALFLLFLSSPSYAQSQSFDPNAMPITDPNGDTTTLEQVIKNVSEGVISYTALKLPNFRAALAKVKLGTSNARVVVIGDSTTTGFNALGVAQWPSITGNMALELKRIGIPSTDNSFCGFSVPGTSTTGSRLANDPRMTAGSWSSNLNTLGGAILYTSITEGSPFVFTPQTDVDTYNIIYSPYGASVTATATVTGGSDVILDWSTSTLQTATVTGTSGSSLSISYNTGSSGTAYVECIEAYDSTTKSVNFINAGHWGTKIENWIDAQNVYSNLPMIDYIDPDLTIITPGINDWGAGTDITTFKSNLTILVQRALQSGDVILTSPTPSATGVASTQTQRQYVDIMYEVAEENGVLMIDNHKRWGTYTSANSLGYMSDGLHPTAVGFADQASAIVNVIGKP